MADLTKHSVGSKSKATKSFTSTWINVGANPFFELRYYSDYDYGRAELEEWYTLYEKRFGWRGKEKWRPFKERTYIGTGDSRKGVVRGDLAWAKKVAKDLGIEVPPATHRLSQRLATTQKPAKTSKNAKGKANS